MKEAGKNVSKTTMEKNGIYPATFYSWKKKFESMGEVGDLTVSSWEIMQGM